MHRQYTFVIIYPVYLFTFMNVPDSVGPSLAFLILLPLLKCVSCVLFARVVQRSNGEGELVQRHIVLTSDVIGSLFVAICVQYRPSQLVSSCIVVITVATKTLSLHDIRSAEREIVDIKRQISQRRYTQTSDQHISSQYDDNILMMPNILDEVVEIIDHYSTSAREI